MPIAVSDVAQLASVLRRDGWSRQGALLALDGFNGRGKTTAALALAAALGAKHIDADDFIVDGSLCYPMSLDRERLSRVLRRDLESHLVVFSSVLALEVLNNTLIACDCLIYVRHSWPEGTFTDAEILYPNRPVEELLAAEDELCVAAAIGANEPVLGRELLHYHLRHLPHQSAQYILDVCFDPSAA